MRGRGTCTHKGTLSSGIITVHPGEDGGHDREGCRECVFEEMQLGGHLGTS